MPATCLRQGHRCYRRYSPAYVNVWRRHVAVIAGCLGPCHRQTGEVELSSTLPVCRRCFWALSEDRRWFFSMWMPVGGWRRHPCVIWKLRTEWTGWKWRIKLAPSPWRRQLTAKCLRHVWGLSATHLELVCNTTWDTANVLPQACLRHMWTRLYTWTDICVLRTLFSGQAIVIFSAFLLTTCVYYWIFDFIIFNNTVNTHTANKIPTL